LVGLLWAAAALCCLVLVLPWQIGCRQVVASRQKRYNWVASAAMAALSRIRFAHVCAVFV
jgi:hypothetical protein